MKKIILVIFGLVLIFSMFGSASAKTVSKKKETGEKSPYVLIQYRAAPKVCTASTNDQDNNFGWGGWRLQSGVTDYRINFNTLPSSISRETASSVIDASFSAIQGAGGGILFHYAGESGESNASNNGQNSIFWQSLPVSIVGLTYIWVDGNNRLTDADTIFNSRFRWSDTAYNGQNDCGGQKGAFDLKDIATHEFGHWAGLGDLYDSRSKDLTMYGYASRGELKKGTLGLGDEIGVRAVWPL